MTTDLIFTQILSNLQFWVDMYAIDESSMEWKEALRDILFNRFERVCYKTILYKLVYCI